MQQCNYKQVCILWGGSALYCTLCIKFQRCFHCFKHSIHNFEKIWIQSSSNFSCISSTDSNWCPFKLTFTFRNWKSLLERDQDCRMAVEPLEFCLLWETSGWTSPCAWQCCHNEETSWVSAKVPVMPFAVLLADTVRLSQIILVSLPDLQEYIHNAPYLSSLTELWVLSSSLIYSFCTFFFIWDDFDFYYEDCCLILTSHQQILASFHMIINCIKFSSTSSCRKRSVSSFFQPVAMDKFCRNQLHTQILSQNS